MKVAINRCYGGFGLSDKAVEMCIDLGMTVGDENQEDVDFNKSSLFRRKYYCSRSYEKSFRCDLRVIKVIEQLGDEASDTLSKIRIVEIPFDS